MTLTSACYLLALVTLAIVPMRARQTPEPLIRAGVVTSNRGESVLAMPGALLPSGTKLTLITPGEPQTIRTARIEAESPSDGDDVTEHTLGPYYDIEPTDSTKPLPELAIAVLAVPTPTRMDRVFSLNVSPALPDVRAKWCASFEGLHFTLWSGAPLAGKRVWHMYYSAPMNFRPTCTAAETHDDGGTRTP